jgi:hypothetical protein
MAAINVHLKKIQFVSSWVIILFDKNYIPAQRDFLLGNIFHILLIIFCLFSAVYKELTVAYLT